jgi:hypothetical protein
MGQKPKQMDTTQKIKMSTDDIQDIKNITTMSDNPSPPSPCIAPTKTNNKQQDLQD